jgi:hypothetical protein
MSMLAKWNNVLSTLFEKRTGYTHIQQARPALACIKAYNAPILCSFVWRIHHVNWQVAELLTITCQISRTTGRCTLYNIVFRRTLKFNKDYVLCFAFLTTSPFPRKRTRGYKQHASSDLYLCIYSLYLTKVQYFRTCASSDNITGDAWNELVMTLCDVISWKLMDGTGENHEAPIRK